MLSKLNKLMSNFEEMLKENKKYEELIPTIQEMFEKGCGVLTVCSKLFRHKYSIPKGLLDNLKKNEDNVYSFLWIIIHSDEYYYDKEMYDVLKTNVSHSAEIEAALIKKGIEVPEQIKGSLLKIDEYERNSFLYSCLDCIFTYRCRGFSKLPIAPKEGDICMDFVNKNTNSGRK